MPYFHQASQLNCVEFSTYPCSFLLVLMNLMPIGDQGLRMCKLFSRYPDAPFLASKVLCLQILSFDIYTIYLTDKSKS